MNKKHKLLLAAWLLSVGTVAYADQNLADPQAEQRTPPAAPERPSEEDLLRKQKLSTPNAPTARPSYEQLLANPRQFEQVFAYRLATGQKKDLAQLAELYKRVPDRDESLIEWAEAALLAENNLNQSVRAYRTLSAKFPENDFIRFQMAAILFYNQEFDAAKIQFEKLRASAKANAADIAVFEQYLQAIAKKDKWNLSFGMQFLNDPNLTGEAKPGTEMHLPNGAVLVKQTPREKGTGVQWNAGANKQWSLDGGRFAALESGISHKYYWNNQKFNELNINVGAGYGYADARANVKLMPYIAKEWNGGGRGGSSKLKQNTDTYGANLSGAYWLTPSLKLMGNYHYSYVKYRDKHDKDYDGSTHSLSSSLMYLNGTKQYFGGGLDYSRRNAKEDSHAYRRNGVRAFWGQEWPLGLATSSSIGVAKRYYNAPYLGIAKRRNTEYHANVSLWHKSLHFAGFTPRLTASYQKTKSNFSLFSYDKKQVFLEVDKTF